MIPKITLHFLKKQNKTKISMHTFHLLYIWTKPTEGFLTATRWKTHANPAAFYTEGSSLRSDILTMRGIY